MAAGRLVGMGGAHTSSHTCDDAPQTPLHRPSFKAPSPPTPPPPPSTHPHTASQMLMPFPTIHATHAHPPSLHLSSLPVATPQMLPLHAADAPTLKLLLSAARCVLAPLLLRSLSQCTRELI